MREVEEAYGAAAGSHRAELEVDGGEAGRAGRAKGVKQGDRLSLEALGGGSVNKTYSSQFSYADLHDTAGQ